MLKKVSLFLLCVVLTLAVGCKKNNESLSVDMGDEPSIPEQTVDKSEYSVNPLTGIKNLKPGKEYNRPVAITINNISVAQPVQTGLAKADIVYETEVEGGITRLVALFQDTTGIEKIGTVRSARYAFIDLAMGHNAIYVHHGQDSSHAGAHLKDVDHFVVSENNGGVRISNGLASEHTLYAYGDGLWREIINDGFNTKNTKVASWQNFADESESVTLGNAAEKVTVPFSASYKTTMQYDSATGKYKRMSNGTERKDYVTKESLYFKNVFVLTTTIRTYPNCNDGYNHKEVLLNSGDGYYFVNGTYTPIKWSKGSASNGFKFTNSDGTPLTVNTGNSWVCISDMTRSKPIIE